MRRLCVIVLAICLQGLSFMASAQVDSTVLESLDKRLDEYFQTMEAESADFKSSECDILISSASSAELKQHIAQRAYWHYQYSKLMGDEAVAVHIADRWFLSGEIGISGEDLFSVRFFADTNRRSLIGCKAPSMELRTLDGSPYSLTFDHPADGRSILCFYDTQCSKCKLETLVLKSLMEDRDYPVTLYAVYTGDDEQEWRSWVSSRFTYNAPSVRVVNLWDPYGESDFPNLYGVIQTPKMFLMESDGTIVGRGLDTDALEQLLDALAADDYYEYASEASTRLMDGIFEACGSSMSPEDVMETAGLIAGKTLHVGDTLNFKHLCGDLLYYLSNQRGEAFKEGTIPFVDEYILSRPDIWSSSDDSLRVVGMASLMKDLLSKAPVGSRMPKNFDGVRLPKQLAPGWKKLCRRGGYVFFHTSGCPYCEQELAAAKELGLRYLDIDLDRLEESSPEFMTALLDTFDLSELPYIMQVGRRGTILRRYLTLLS